MINNMRPIHPGEQLRDELEELGMSARTLAKALKVPVNRITAILNGQRGVTADTALRLARYFGGTPEFWLNLQSAYELRRARQAAGEKIVQEVKPRAAPAKAPGAGADPGQERPSVGSLSGQ
jgi:antitoxin HigA-1